jgi:hypothetical protein
VTLAELLRERGLPGRCVAAPFGARLVDEDRAVLVTAVLDRTATCAVGEDGSGERLLVLHDRLEVDPEQVGFRQGRAAP